MKKLTFLMVLFLLTLFSCNQERGQFTQETGQFTDARDGKTYKTVKIGTQTWMAENLAYNPWGNSLAYDADPINIDIYGYLYNWQEAKEICPDGWHLPSNDEWTTLISLLGGEKVAAGKLKEIGTTHWESPNKGAIHRTFFNALPGGFGVGGSPQRTNWGSTGMWWSSTEGEYTVAMQHKYKWLVLRNFRHGSYYGSVRCVKD